MAVRKNYTFRFFWISIEIIQCIFYEQNEITNTKNLKEKNS